MSKLANRCRKPLSVAATALAMVCAGAAQAAENHSMHGHHAAAMDHSQHQAAAADHSKMDHSKMDHSKHHAGADGSDPHAAHRAAMTKPAGRTTLDVAVPDARLLDQDGRKVSFVGDVLGEKVAIVNFVYTTCTTVCPVQSAVFGELQKRLADRIGDSVSLVSVTVDPLRDTPARLKKSAAKYGAGPNWTWLTGERAEVEDVLRAYGAYTQSFEDHPPLVLVGDALSGKWTRFFGFPDVGHLVEAVEQALASRASAPLAKAQ